MSRSRTRTNAKNTITSKRAPRHHLVQPLPQGSSSAVSAPDPLVVSSTPFSRTPNLKSAEKNLFYWDASPESRAARQHPNNANFKILLEHSHESSRSSLGKR